MYSLNDLKAALYGGARPLLLCGDGTVPTESEFVFRFFPRDYYVQTFLDENGKRHTLRTLLSNETGGAKAQRNRVFNGRYTGNKMEDDALPILRTHPAFWEQFRINCQQALLDVDPKRTRELADTLLELGGSVGNDAYTTFLEQKIRDGELETAFASVIICLMARVRIDDFLQIFNGSISLEDQYGYLDHPKSMLKRAFQPILEERSFGTLGWKFYEDYAALLGHASEISSDGAPVQGHLLSTLYDVIRQKDARKLIRITGPSGAEKNAITQLLYLRLAADVRESRETVLAPYYIDLGMYRRQGLTDREEIREQMRVDLHPFRDFCHRQPHRVPLLLIDGIKTYAYDCAESDYLLGELIQELLPRVRLVIAVERGVVMNPYRQRNLPAFASGHYAYEVSMESIYLFDKRKTMDYLEKFREIYMPEARIDLYTRLRELELDHVDTYQLRVLASHMEEAENICDLYNAVCMTFLGGDTSQMEEAARWAFDFAYTDRPLPPIPFNLQQLINTHDSFVEYFVALDYISKLRSGAADKDFHILEMTLPKGITRFLLPMLSGSPADESRLLDLIQRAYGQMPVMAKSEMAYFLGRLKAPNLAEHAEFLLQQYYQMHRQEMEQAAAMPALAYKRQLYLLRGISISLIVKGHREVLDDYLMSLLRDPLANEINRASELEFYGDHYYLPAYDTLDLEDDIQTGQRTLDQLMAAVEMSKETGQVPLIIELKLVTICSLLQARVENTNRGVSFDLMPYLNRAISQVDWYLGSRLCDSEMLEQYFLMVKRDFKERKDERYQTWSPMGAKTYRRYTDRVLRADWVKHNIPEPETVAEHMYNTWALGMLLLPEEYSGDPGYSKEKILELVLIHDMAEAVTGDIRRSEKEQDPLKYRKQENEETGILLLRGTYAKMPSQFGRYQLWQKWDEQRRDINGRIARELDLTQCLFMLLTYYSRYPEHFTREEVRKWMNDRNQIRTVPGSQVYKTVITQNPEFHDVLRKLEIL